MIYLDECTNACNNDDNCHGFVFDKNVNNCWLKNSNIYPKGDKQPLFNADLYVRTPSVCTSTSFNKSICSSEFVNIDSVQYDAYIKGENMAPGLNFAPEMPGPKVKERLSELETELASLADQISQKLNTTDIEREELNCQISTGQSTTSDDLNKYYEIKKQIDFLLEKDPNYKKSKLNSDATYVLDTKQKNNYTKMMTGKKPISGTKSRSRGISGSQNGGGGISGCSLGNNDYVQTVEGMLNMKDLEAMVSDSDLVVLQQNSQYIFWSLLALGILVITVNTLKK